MITLNMLPLEGRDRARWRRAGIVWFCAIQFFIVQMIATWRWTAPFSLVTNNISDLGNTSCDMYPAVGGTFICSPWYVLMNISFALQGVIIIAGSILVRQVIDPSTTRTVVFWLLIVTGLGLLGVGAFPENVNNRAHTISAGVQFVTGNAAILIFGFAAYRILGGRLFSAISVALGGAGLAATILFALGIGLGVGLGTVERIAAYTLPIWLITAGTILQARDKPIQHQNV